jgi:hypothetical protein
MLRFFKGIFIYIKCKLDHVLENLTLIGYAIMGFVISYLALEIGWHYTACRIKDKSVPPCVFKQIRVIAANKKRLA